MGGKECQQFRSHSLRTERRLRERIAELPDVLRGLPRILRGGPARPGARPDRADRRWRRHRGRLRGLEPQVPGVVNSSFAVTGAGVFVAVKSTLDPDSTRSGAACSGSARAMRWSCAASHSPARRAAWPILRRSRIASRIGGAGGASNLGCPCAPSVDSMVAGRANEVNHGARRARVLRNRSRRLRKADPYAGAGAPGTGSLAMRFTSL